MRERGFALVAALWVSVLLALAAGAVLQMGRSGIVRTRVMTETVRMDAIADAALNLGLARLAGPSAEQPPLDGTAFAVTIDDVTMLLRIEDETGKVNLNLADARILGLLLASVVVAPEAAQGLTERLLAWRSERPFRSVGQLRTMDGIDAGLFARLEPAVTVWSDTDWIDPGLAGPAVLASLGMAPPAVRARSFAAPGHAYTLRVAPAGGGPSRVAVVRLTGQSARPFLVYRWD